MRGGTTLYGRVERVEAGIAYVRTHTGDVVPCAADEATVEVLAQREDTVGLDGEAEWDPDTRRMLSFTVAEVTPYCGDGVSLVEAFARLREATAGAYDNVDVDKFMCFQRHDDGCACTGAPVESLEDCEVSH